MCITSTDMQDRLFLCRMVRTYCPEALIFTTNAFMAWTHPKESRWTRGMIVVNSFPMNSRIQEWIRDSSNPAPARLFTSNKDHAFHSAIAIQLWEASPSLKAYSPRLQGYGMPTLSLDSSKNSQGEMPIWISVVSQQGLFPLKVQSARNEDIPPPWDIPPLSTRTRNEDIPSPWKTPPLSPIDEYRGDEARPLPSWLVSGATGWRSLFLLNSALHLFFGGLFIVRSAQSRAAFENGETRSGLSSYRHWRGLPFQVDLLFWSSLRFGNTPLEIERRRTLFLMGALLWATQLLLAFPAWLPLLYAPSEVLLQHGQRNLWADILIFAAFWVVGLTAMMTAWDHWSEWLRKWSRAIGTTFRIVLGAAMIAITVLASSQILHPGEHAFSNRTILIECLFIVGFGGMVWLRRRRYRELSGFLVAGLTGIRGDQGLSPSQVEERGRAIGILNRISLAAKLALATGGLFLFGTLALSYFLSPEKSLAFALFRERASALASGVSPLLPFALAQVALLVLGLTRLRLLDLQGTSRAGAELLGTLLDESTPAASTSSPSSRVEPRQPANELRSALGLGEEKGIRELLREMPLGFWVVVSVCLGVWTWIYLFRQGSLECWGLNLLLFLTITALAVVTVGQIAKLIKIWRSFREFADAFAEHPASRGFDRLPGSVARDFGKYFEPIISQSREESHLRSPQARRSQALHQGLSRPSRQAAILDRLATELVVGSNADQETGRMRIERARGILDERHRSGDPAYWMMNSMAPAFPSSLNRKLSPALAHLLTPFWDRLSASQALASAQPSRDQDKEKPKESPSSCAWVLTTPACPASSDDASDPNPNEGDLEAWLNEAEDYVANRAVTYTNAIVHQIWTRVTALALCGGLVFIIVRSYPMQPYEIAAQTAGALTLTVAAVILWILVGYQSNPLISRITKRSAGFSAFSPEFIGKFFAYVGALVGLMAAASAGIADLLRIWLDPWLS